MIRNFFWALGPNVSHYPGAYPNGFLERCKSEGFWGMRRLHLCSGTVADGVTIDCKRELRPSILADLEIGIPCKDETFDAIFIDPPYSEEHAAGLYGVHLLSVPRLLTESARVVRRNGFVCLLSWSVWTTWSAKKNAMELYALGAVYTANRGVKPLRALSVWKKRPHPLEHYDED